MKTLIGKTADVEDCKILRVIKRNLAVHYCKTHIEFTAESGCAARKVENARYAELMASDAAEFEQMRAHRDTPPITPEDIQAYGKKTDESNEVIAMLHSRWGGIHPAVHSAKEQCLKFATVG